MANALLGTADENQLLTALADPEYYRLMLAKIPEAARAAAASLLSAPVETVAAPYRAAQGLANYLVPGGAQEFSEPLGGYQAFRQALGGAEAETPTEAIAGIAGGLVDPFTAAAPIAKLGAAMLAPPAALLATNRLLGLPEARNAGLFRQGGMVSRVNLPKPVSTAGTATSAARPVAGDGALSVKAPNKAVAEEWSKWLEGAQRRGEVSKEERLDMGLDEWLEANKGKTITRDDLQRAVAERVPRIEVVNPAGGKDEHALQEIRTQAAIQLPQEMADDQAVWNRIVGADVGPDGKPVAHPAWDEFKDRDERLEYIENNLNDPENNEVAAWMNEWVESEYDSLLRAGEIEPIREAGGTRYQTYQLPGGSDYHERLIKVPAREPKTSDAFEMRRRRVEGSADYFSPHWDEQNVVAHWRANTRDVGGTPSYHVEEIQSDWHQTGRDKGYAGSGDPTKYTAEYRPPQVGFTGGWQIKDAAGKDVGIVPAADRVDGRRASEIEPDEAVAWWLAAGTVPDAPFKKSWPLLTMKNALTEAVDRGASRVSWTPGAEQAARYSLDKHVGTLMVSKNAEGLYKLDGSGPRGGTIPGASWRGLTAEELPQYVGKELAAKIVKGEGGEVDKFSGSRIYSGLDLRVGGEGQREFYDKILVNQMNDFLKRYGSKVQYADIDVPKPIKGSSNLFAGESRKLRVPYFEITPQLKAAVEQGLPLY